MEDKSKHTGFRWAVLGFVLINSFFNTLYNLLNLPGNTVSEVSDTYKTLFTPAGYAFAIWGIIYLAFIIYAVYQLLPAQRHSRFFDRMAWPVILANLLCILWQLAFRNYLIGGSVAIILAILATAIVMQTMARRETHNRTLWLTVPFNLFLGWICVATIANIASWLTALGWNGGNAGPDTWAIIMILAALLTGILLSIAYRDYIVPLVMAWALTAIYAEVLYTQSSVANMALIAGIVSALWASGIFLYYQKKPWSIEVHKNMDA